MPHWLSQMQPVPATKKAVYTKLTMGCCDPIVPPVPILSPILPSHFLALTLMQLQCQSVYRTESKKYLICVLCDHTSARELKTGTGL